MEVDIWAFEFWIWGLEAEEFRDLGALDLGTMALLILDFFYWNLETTEFKKFGITGFGA